VQALDGVSFAVQEGEVFGLLGPNGAGKSTTVRVLATLTRPDAGRAEVADKDVLRAPGEVRRSIGYVPQESGIDTYGTGRENLTLQGRVQGLRGSRLKGRVEFLLELMGLSAAADRVVSGYSGGMKRRLDIALGLVHRPRLLFLDEPTTGLDPSGRRETWELIHRLAAAGTTVMLTTHYMDEVEALADRVAVLYGQEIVAEGTPSSLGGRDLGAVTIRFRLPDGVTVESLPVPAVPADDGHVAVHTDDEVRVLHELTGWALAHGLPLVGLSVLRTSLEDVYLGLTRGVGSDAVHGPAVGL